jgi:hypothetical protein
VAGARLAGDWQGRLEIVIVRSVRAALPRSGNSIGPVGALSLAQALQGLAALTRFDLRSLTSSSSRADPHTQTRTLSPHLTY